MEGKAPCKEGNAPLRGGHTTKFRGESVDYGEEHTTYGGGRTATGVSGSYETAHPKTLCLGPCGGPRGVAVSYERGTPVEEGTAPITVRRLTGDGGRGAPRMDPWTLGRVTSYGGWNVACRLMD